LAWPWRKIGRCSNNLGSIEASGLDWEVGTKDLVTKDGYDVPARATYRKTDNTILGVVGPRYVPLQNKDAFNWFQPFIDAGECSLHTGGSLSDGQKVWALAQLNRDPSEIVKGDEVQKFILLSNSHDGTTAIRVGYTPIRVVCVNTLAFAHQNGVSKLLRIRHTKSAAANLDNVRDIMDNINGQFEATAEQFRFLAGRNFNQVDVRKYVKTLLNVEKTADEDLKTRTKNILDDVLATIEGPKQSMPGVKGTWWAAYNGFNEYLNYTKGRNTNNRMESLWFGQNGAANNRALALATEYANSL